MIGVIIQARTGSTRFPNKIFTPITEDKYTLQMVLEGVKQAILPHKIILAMPTYDESEVFIRDLKNEFSAYTDDRFETYFGDANDLVNRYFGAANKFGLDLIVRITADCPLIQGDIIDDMLTEYIKLGCNGYMGNVGICKNSYPNGLDVEIFPYWMLADTMRFCKDPVQREHVCPYMYNSTKYKIYQYQNLSPHRIISTNVPDFSFDTDEDLKLIREIAKHYSVYNELRNLNYALSCV